MARYLLPRLHNAQPALASLDEHSDDEDDDGGCQGDDDDGNDGGAGNEDDDDDVVREEGVEAWEREAGPPRSK